MNWEALGAIGEVFGAIAVFITLAYLAVQVRHARADSQRALSQGRVEGLRDLFALATDERINRLAVKASAALGARQPLFVSALIEQADLTQEEASLLFSYNLSWWNSVVQIIPNIDELSAIERRQFDGGVLGRYARNTVGGLFFETLRPSVHPDVVSYIENVLARAA